MSIQELLKNNFILSLIMIVVTFLVTKIINIFFNTLAKKSENKLYIVFIKKILQALVIVICVIRILSFSDTFQTFYSSILMSSSLLVVLMGFILQEGLSNVVHGVILTLFKPFQIGDRIEVNIDGNIISGFVKNIDLRHTTIQNIIDNSLMIVPNAKLDISFFKNFSNEEETNKYPISINISYEDGCIQEKRERAKKIISDCILNNKYVIDTREKKSEQLFVKVEIKEYYIKLTSFVVTKTISDNWIACSDITESILNEFSKNNIRLAYPHTEISGIIRNI